MKITLKPHITEKAFKLISDAPKAVSQYTFKVSRLARKEEIKAAVESQFKVNVEDVRVINLPSKERRFRGKAGRTSIVRKAIVRLQAGQRIKAFELSSEPAESVTEAK